MNYVIYATATGEILEYGTVPDQTHFNLVSVPAGASIVEADTFPDLQGDYYPGGVKFSRPLFTSVASWNKTTINGNGSDQCTLGNGLPSPTAISVMHEETGALTTHSITTGSFSFSSTVAGSYLVVANKFPYKEYRTVITVNKAIAQRRAERWTAIKALRKAREYSTFTWNGLIFDADAESQRRIQGAVQLAQLAISQGSPFSIDWTLADDSVETLSAADMVAVGVALGQHVQTQYATARTLRQQINGAGSQEDLDAIGWPS